MKYYKINIKETLSNESVSFGCDKLNLASWKAIKKELIDMATNTGNEHELVLVEVVDNDHATNGCFIGRGTKEREITRIKFGASVFERALYRGLVI